MYQVYPIKDVYKKTNSILKQVYLPPEDYYFVIKTRSGVLIQWFGVRISISSFGTPKVPMSSRKCIDIISWLNITGSIHSSTFLMSFCSLWARPSLPKKVRSRQMGGFPIISTCVDEDETKLQLSIRSRLLISPHLQEQFFLLIR